jgi:phosphate-selective porin OprO/OprP
MLGNHRGLLGTVSLATVLAAGSAGAQSAQVSADQIDQLQAQITKLEHELQGLKAKTTAAEKAYATAAPVTKAAGPAPTAVVKMSPGNRPSICTPDNLNCIAITSRLHLDVGGYWYHPNTAATVPQNLDNGINARRARIGVLGTFMGDWNYGLVYDFGGSSDGLPPVSGAPISGIENAFISYVGIKPVAIELGYMDVPYTLDEATGSNEIMFMERASSQVVASNIAAGDFRSAFGIRGNDDRFWAGAYVTGPTSGTTHIATPTANNIVVPPVLGSPGFSEQIGGFGRVAYQLVQDPKYSLHVGGGAEFLFKPVGTNALTLSDRPELRIDPTAILSTGTIANVTRAQVYSAELAGGAGPVYFQGEYFWYNVERSLGLPSLQFQGWYAEGSWTLTGESRKYNPAIGAYPGIVPNNPVSLSMGTWGAWELAARYSYINLNDLFTPGIPASVTSGVAGGKQNIYTLALNWYVNRNIRFMVNYLHGTVDKFSGAAANSGADLGAHFDALAMRTQVAF